MEQGCNKLYPSLKSDKLYKTINHLIIRETGILTHFIFSPTTSSSILDYLNWFYLVEVSKYSTTFDFCELVRVEDV